MANEDKRSARFEFPLMLYDMLEDVSDDPKLSKIVSWMPHGRAFKVHRPDDFEVKVMPQYFRERYSSFRYLLEQWGFQGLRRGRDRGAYYNILFVRGERYNIVNATKELMLSVMPEYLAPKDEPDFYSSMPSPPDHSRTTRARVNEKRKQTQEDDDDDIPETTIKQSKKVLKKTKTNKTQQSETKAALASDNDDFDPSSSSNSSTSPSLNAPPVRGKVRSTPRVQYSEAQRQRKARQSLPEEEESAHPSNRKRSSKSRGVTMSSIVEESTGKDPWPMLFRPTKPVFSGFGIPVEKLKFVVMTANEAESHESFVVKPLVSASIRKQTAH